MSIEMVEKLETFLQECRESTFPAEVSLDNLNVKSSCGDTLLHRALWGCEFEIARELVERGVDVNIHGDMGDTALHVSTRKGFFEMMTFLLERGANPLAINEWDKTPAMYAARLEQPEFYRHLFAHTFKSEELITLLDTRQVDLNLDEYDRSNHGYAQALENCGKALRVALLDENVPLVQELVLLGASTDVPDDKGRLPLHLAVMLGNLEIVQFLVKTVCLTSQTDNMNFSPLDLAKAMGHTEVVAYLRDVTQGILEDELRRAKLDADREWYGKNR